MAHKLVTVRKASGENVPDLIIEATVPFWSDLEADAARQQHERSGREIAEAIRATLPGGTIEQLLLRLLDHQAPLCGVRYRPMEK